MARLRVPFVVTVVMSAAGCGTVEETCPSTPPTEGDACERSAGGTCDYGDCAGSPTTTAECRSGKWALLETSCNPPPPVETTCPVGMPGDGTYCNYSGPQCVYLECFGAPSETAECSGHAWVVSVTSCNPPPPPVCPADLPAEGGPCDARLVSPCTYYPDCVQTFGEDYEAWCVSGAWEIRLGPGECNPPPPVEECPGQSTACCCDGDALGAVLCIDGRLECTDDFYTLYSGDDCTSPSGPCTLPPLPDPDVDAGDAAADAADGSSP